jgi:hypothetical protein
LGLADPNAHENAPSLLNRIFLNLFLDYEKTWEEASEKSDHAEVYYEEPDLCGGIEVQYYGRA